MVKHYHSITVSQYHCITVSHNHSTTGVMQSSQQSESTGEYEIQLEEYRNTVEKVEESMKYSLRRPNHFLQQSNITIAAVHTDLS